MANLLNQQYLSQSPVDRLLRFLTGDRLGMKYSDVPTQDSSITGPPDFSRSATAFDTLVRGIPAGTLMELTGGEYAPDGTPVQPEITDISVNPFIPGVEPARTVFKGSRALQTAQQAARTADRVSRAGRTARGTVDEALVNRAWEQLYPDAGSIPASTYEKLENLARGGRAARTSRALDRGVTSLSGLEQAAQNPAQRFLSTIQGLPDQALAGLSQRAQDLTAPQAFGLASAVPAGVTLGASMSRTPETPEPQTIGQAGMNWLDNLGATGESIYETIRDAGRDFWYDIAGIPRQPVQPTAEARQASAEARGARTAEMNELLERNQELERQLAQQQSQLSPYTLDLNQIFADETAENRAVREQLMALLTPQERERTTGDTLAGIGRALSAASLGGLGQDVSSIFREEDAFDERLSPRDQAMINLLAPQAMNTQQSQRALQLAQALANLQLTQAQAGAVSALADQRNQPDLIQQMLAERQQRQLQP